MELMSFLCTPNGIPIAALGVGCIGAIIWLLVDRRFRQIPDDPMRRVLKQDFGRLIVLLGGGTGYIVGLVLSQFISFRC